MWEVHIENDQIDVVLVDYFFLIDEISVNTNMNFLPNKNLHFLLLFLV